MTATRSEHSLSALKQVRSDVEIAVSRVDQAIIALRADGRHVDAEEFTTCRDALVRAAAAALAPLAWLGSEVRA